MCYCSTLRSFTIHSVGKRGLPPTNPFNRKFGLALRSYCTVGAAFISFTQGLHSYSNNQPHSTKSIILYCTCNFSGDRFLQFGNEQSMHGRLMRAGAQCTPASISLFYSAACVGYLRRFCRKAEQEDALLHSKPHSTKLGWAQNWTIEPFSHLPL